jgi:hypothetical protein
LYKATYNYVSTKSLKPTAGDLLGWRELNKIEI